MPDQVIQCSIEIVLTELFKQLRRNIEDFDEEFVLIALFKQLRRNIEDFVEEFALIA
jgi:hypothetical protein